MYTTLEVFKVLEELVVLVVLVETVDQPYVQTKTEILLSTITLEHQSTPAVAEVVAEVTVVLEDKVVLEVQVVPVLITYNTTITMQEVVVFGVVEDTKLISKDLQTQLFSVNNVLVVTLIVTVLTLPKIVTRNNILDMVGFVTTVV